MPDAITINHKNDKNMQKRGGLQNSTQDDFDEMIEFGRMYGDEMGSTFCFY